jgi:hydrogenase maturation protein HypF
MRPWIYRVAHEQGIRGRVWNDTNGVCIEAFGAPETLDAFVEALAVNQPPAAVTESVVTAPIPAEDATGFVIIESRRATNRRVSIPADLATCAACAAEIRDPNNRRFRYPFTNCTNCGPRFTIATDVPYDRSATTMARFGMCAECQREYDDPSNRRFHAEPNACPSCGPQLRATWPSGELIETTDAIRYAARVIDAGYLVAVKGIGGFHLACDALSSPAVVRLRLRKHREEKPLAVMVADIAQARRLAVISREERELLESAERPIVLVPRRPGADLAPEVAPHNPLIGLMLPYSPLHHVLLSDVGKPLVMTSANVTDEPIVYRNDEATARLKGIADILLIHDREIVTACDDSVATTIAGAPVVLRRSRGFVPRPITLRHTLDVPVLACGALLKNTFCLAHRNQAWIGPHIGDLENAEAFEAYQDAIVRMERFLGLTPEVVAHDLHPDYLSTRYAYGRGLATFGVQHHHAHVVSAMAEHGLDGAVLGVAFDGTGYGTDGTSWGGEFLVGDARSMLRVATFRPLRLPGGDAAVRQPWRTARAALSDAAVNDATIDTLALFRGVAETERRGVEQMLVSALNTPLAHGVGRYFDAVGALVLARPQARYEGQLAFELNMLADPSEYGSYAYAIDCSAGMPEVDFRPVIQAVVADLLDGVPAGTIAARFHNAIVTATAAMVREVGRRAGLGSRPAVVLTGGCFQNARLAEGLLAALAADYQVYLHRRVPPGDGGISLGQAVAAAAAIEG